MRRFLLLLACLPLASCVPPYIAVLDSSAGVAARMTTLVTYGPVKLPGSPGDPVRFFPVKPTTTTTSLDALPPAGFAVTEHGGYAYLQYVYVNTSGQAQSDGWTALPLNVSSPTYPLYEYDVTTTTTTANIVVLYMHPTSQTLSAALLYTAPLAGGSITQSGSTQPLQNVFASTPAVGVQMVPLSGAADSFNFLLVSGTSTYSYGSTSVSTSTPVFTPGTPAPITQNPGLPSPRALFYQSGSFSYVSFSSGSGWVCEQLTASTLTVLPGVTHRIDAVLTDGTLLSTEGGTLRLYDSTGSQVASASLGGLQFCYEAYVGATPYVFFSLSMPVHNGCAFRVYAIPTSSIRSLGG